MAISKLDRARIILDLTRDGNVATEAPYANVDKIDGPTGNKYVEALYSIHGPIKDRNGDPIDYADLTNDQKGTFYINQLREWHRIILQASRVPPVRESAADAERATVLSEVDSELGADE